ncbi:MAG: hypothetical protein JKY66_07120 [Spongiibacteraceae bacterium]|nr:hypothetical protein [Spongiibacteraceae bacterium]
MESVAIADNETIRPSFIDVEASGLGRGSYPIEVGLALANGGSACVIIRPQAQWKHWDSSAQALHGISRETLECFGRSPLEAATFINQLLVGQVVYSDAWGNDSSWLALLFDCAGIPLDFKLDSLRSLLSEEQVAIWHKTKEAVVAQQAFTRHRASNDALILQHTYCRIDKLVNKH